MLADVSSAGSDPKTSEQLLPAEADEARVLEPAEAATTRRSAIIRQVSFALSELTSDNAAHHFEDLCRHVARARLAANIIPATGPVGAGGDQGRDFETYRTYLAAQLGHHGGFAGHVQEGAVAFACTLQQDNLPTKIRDDVRKICSGGVSVESIYCFLVVPMAVGVRHRLQKELEVAYGVHVEILDRKWLSEELSDAELFWIAEEYLSLAATLAPARADAPGSKTGLPAWYLADRDRWRARAAARPTLGELLDLRDGLRHATFHLKARADLPFWLSLMEPLCGDSGRDVRQRARYETAVAQMRGLKDLRPVDGHVADFFEEASDEDDPARLSDAGVLLTYASVAYSYAQSGLKLKQLQAWGEALRQRVEHLLDDDPPPVRRARLLEVLGQLYLAPEPGSIGRAPEPTPLPEMAELEDEDGRPLAPISPPDESERYFVDVSRGLWAWGELAASLPQLPLFPVDEMARLLELLSPLLVDEDSWSDIVMAVDTAVARAEGDAAAGDRALGRAQALLAANRLLDALGELHNAKIRFFHGDHPRSLASTLLALGDVYGKLHLPLAARQHALAAATAARASETDEVGDLVPHALFMASEHDYRAGSFASALQVLRVAMLAQHALVDPDVDPWSERDFGRAVVTAGYSFKAAHDLLAGPFVDAVDELLNSVAMLENLRDVGDGIDKWSEQEWADRVDSQLEGRPYADVGPRRAIRFAALGLTWTISCANEHLAVLAAERLAAAAQVLCADLAGDEFLLLPTAVEIDVELRSSGGTIELRERPRSEGRGWVVELGSVGEGNSLDPDEVTRELMATLGAILREVSLLTDDAFFAAIERSFARGITHKLCPVRPYDELVPYAERHFESLPCRAVVAPLESGHPPAKCHPEMTWASGPGPGYSAEEAEGMLTNRYEQLPKLMPVTLRMLRNDRRFATTVDLLRRRGWLDWHILTATYNLVLQGRLGRAGLNRAEVQATEKGRRAAKDLAFTPEADNEPTVPVAQLLNIARLDEGRQMALASLMMHWGMRLPEGFAIEAAERLLAERYGYWDDDLEHPDPFVN
jgi:hypothetical protein